MTHDGNDCCSTNEQNEAEEQVTKKGISAKAIIIGTVAAASAAALAYYEWRKHAPKDGSGEGDQKDERASFLAKLRFGHATPA